MINDMKIREFQIKGAVDSFAPLRFKIINAPILTRIINLKRALIFWDPKIYLLHVPWKPNRAPVKAGGRVQARTPAGETVNLRMIYSKNLIRLQEFFICNYSETFF